MGLRIALYSSNLFPIDSRDLLAEQPVHFAIEMRKYAMGFVKSLA